MATYIPQGALVVLDHDPYEDKSSRPALILSDDKHPHRYNESVEDPAYTAALCTTGFYTENAWAMKIRYQDLTEGRAFSQTNSHVMLWAVRPVYESDIDKRVAHVSADFLRNLGEAYSQLLDPEVNSL